MLNFIIVGWPTKVKHIGVATPAYCEHCQNNTVYHLIKTRQWLTIFWLPILPISTSSYYLECEICNANLGLEESSTIQSAKDMVEYAESYDNGELTKAEFSNRIEAFEETVSDDPEPKPIREASER